VDRHPSTMSSLYSNNMNEAYAYDAMPSSRYNYRAPTYHTRDGTVLPPTMTVTSRRLRQSTVSVVNMSLAMDVDACGLGIPRHQRCYDDETSPRRRAKRSRRHRRQHHQYHDDDDDNDEEEWMDTADHTPRRHVTHDDVTTRRPVRLVPVEDRSTYRRAGLLAGQDGDASTPKWTSSRYLTSQHQHNDDRRRRRRANRTRHSDVNGDVSRRQETPSSRGAGREEYTRRTSSSPVRHSHITGD